LFSPQLLIVPLALWFTAGGANAQTAATPPTSTSATVSSASHTATHKKGVTHHRHRIRHRIHHRSTSDELSDVLAPQKYPGRLGVSVRLIDGNRVWKPTRHQLGVAYAPGGNDKCVPGTFHFIVKRDVLRKYLGHLAEAIHRSPVDAHPVVADPHSDDPGDKPVPATIVSGKPGVYLDLAAATDTIQKSIEGDPTTVKIELPVKTKAAKVSADQLTGIDSRIGYFITRFNPGEEGRTETVRRAINLIDGTVVPPGGVFSINGTVGERTAARGFGVGHVFINGKMEKQVGGGMCQVATTLFNAAMLADLKIVERHQHVRTIPYVSPGRDATVWWGAKDFKFQNDTDTPVYISYKTTYSHAIVSLYGKDVPGRKVKLVNHYRQLSQRHFTGTFYRVVYGPDGKATKGKTFYSDYEWTPALDYQR
jgi:vancomycin resistance protein YoaR